MKNLKMSYEKDELVIRINLAEEHGPSKSGRSVIVASSEGNLPLHDSKGYLDMTLNLAVYKKKRSPAARR